MIGIGKRWFWAKVCVWLAMATLALPAHAQQPEASQPASKPVMAGLIVEFMVFFDFNKSYITDRAKNVIRAAVEVAKTRPWHRVEVTGYTDTTGSDEYNLALSKRRAEAVKAALVAAGADGSKIDVSGVGKAGLLVPTAQSVREPQNRRVLIYLWDIP